MILSFPFAWLKKFRAAAVHDSPNGFTFLEVMVAVAIMAIAFVTLIGSQSQSITVAADSRFTITAALLAQQKLAQMEAAGFESLFSEEGDFGDQYPSYRWRTEISSLYEEDTGIVQSDELLKAVDLTVSRGTRQELTYTVRSIIMRRMEEQGS